jgi:hypothetical protein
MIVQDRELPNVVESPRAGAFSRTGVVLLVVAPLLMAAGRALLVPLDDQRWGNVLDQMAAHQNRSDAGWILALAAAGLLATTAALLAGRLSRAGRARSATFVLVTTALGWAGCAGICSGGLFMSVVAKAPDRAVQIAILRDFNAGHSGLVFLMCVFAAVGYVVLAVGLARSGATTKGAAVLIGLGGVATLLTMPGPAKPLLVVAALLLAAGHVLARTPAGRTDG